MAWVPIQYRGFWDLPRAFIVRGADAQYLLDCGFNDELDAYEPSYEVYRLGPHVTVPEEGTWEDLTRDAVRLGKVEVSAVRFDPSRRAAVDSGLLDALSRLTSRTDNRVG